MHIDIIPIDDAGAGTGSDQINPIGDKPRLGVNARRQVDRIHAGQRIRFLQRGDQTAIPGRCHTLPVAGAAVVQVRGRIDIQFGGRNRQRYQAKDEQKPPRKFLPESTAGGLNKSSSYCHNWPTVLHASSPSG